MTGIGNDAAARIAYRALSAYMTSTTNYAGARTTFLNVAGALYGTASYAQKCYAVSVAVGASATVKFSGVEDSSLQTSFIIDDTSLQ